VTNYVPLFNGAAGLSLVPSPLQSIANPQGASYQWAYGVVAVLLAFGVYWFVTRITNSPYGRTQRAARDNDVVADSLGKNLRSLRTSSLVVGGAIAGLSGAVLVGFINLWDPQAWGYAETVVLFAAVIIGGLGNHRGAMLGAILVPVAFEEATRYIPPVSGDPNLIPALQWVVIGLLILTFLWFRPQGILPEPRRRLATRQPPDGGDVAPGANGADPGDLGLPAVAADDDVPALPVLRETQRPALPSSDPPPVETILECRDLVRSFDGVRAVDGVSMAFQRGRLTGVIGPNGAGKSTVLAMLAGTLVPTEGQIFFTGEEITNSRRIAGRVWASCGHSSWRASSSASPSWRISSPPRPTSRGTHSGEHCADGATGAPTSAPRSSRRRRRSSASVSSVLPTGTPATSAVASGAWSRSCGR
jgi:ABC-type multidrug transport system fused ATPase/permease subunit